MGKKILNLVFVFLFSNSFFAQSLENSYADFKSGEKCGDYHRMILSLLHLEKKSINKNHYRNIIARLSYTRGDSLSYISVMRRYNFQDSFNLKNLYPPVNEDFRKWRPLLSVESKQVIENEFYATVLFKCVSLEKTHRSKIGSVYLLFQDSLITKNQWKNFTDSIFRLQNQLDSISQSLFKKAIDSLGYLPDFKELSADQVHMQLSIIQHLESSIWKKKLLKTFKKKVKEGTLPAPYYCSALDRYLEMTNQNLYFYETHKAQYGELPPISKRKTKKINKHRIRYGLTPIGSF